MTAAHFVPSVCNALDLARQQGLTLPVVYNSGGYERPETLRLLADYVDIYLPDFKYADEKLARDLSGVPDYPQVALEAIGEMVRQTGSCSFDDQGLLRRGTIVRHLILPGHTRNAIQAIDLLLARWPEEIYISLMNQYTPLHSVPGFHELSRTVTDREYEKVLSHAFDAGLVNGFFQEGVTAKESFIPAFDFTGL